MPSRLEEKILSGQRVLTAELGPPKGSGIKKLSSHALAIKDKVDAINITDCQRALVKMASWAACKVLLDLGCEPVMQLTCRDRNRIALQSDLMGASAIGIRNLLCLTGDPVKVGDCTDAKSVFEIESVKMLHLVRKLQSGHDDGGRKMNAPTKFFTGSTINPTMAGQASQLGRLEKKLEADRQNRNSSKTANIAAAEKPWVEPVYSPSVVLHLESHRGNAALNYDNFFKTLNDKWVKDSIDTVVIVDSSFPLIASQQGLHIKS